MELPFPILPTLFRALPHAGTLFRHPRRIITEVSRNVRAARRLRITKYPRRTPFGQSATKEGTKGAAESQGQRHRGRYELDLSHRQETSSPRARNRSDSDVRVTSCQDPLRRLSCCGLHVANEGVANTWGIYIGNTFGLTSGMEFLDIFKVNFKSNLSLFAKIAER